MKEWIIDMKKLIYFILLFFSVVQILVFISVFTPLIDIISLQLKEIDLKSYRTALVFKYRDFIQICVSICIIVFSILLIFLLKLQNKNILIICIILFQEFTAIYILIKYKNEIFNEQSKDGCKSIQSK
jgi:hypothetical protein